MYKKTYVVYHNNKNMPYTIRIEETALEMLVSIQDARIRGLIEKRIDALANDPDKQGAPLRDDLRGFRSVRAVGQRYRIIYRIDAAGFVVIVGAVGIRRGGARTDIYNIAERLSRRGFL